MKKTFTTTFFRRALFLVLLFGGVTNLWGADNLPKSLSFNWEKYAQNGTTLGGGNSGSDKIIQDGDFQWSRLGENDLKHTNGFCTFKGDDAITVAETRVKYHLLAGVYNVTVTFSCTEGKKCYTPVFIVDENTWVQGTYLQQPSTYQSYNQSTTYTETVQMNVAQDGDYYVRAQFKTTGDEKVGAGTVTFVRTTSCNTLKFEAENQTAWLNLKNDKVLPLPSGNCSFGKDDGANPNVSPNYLEISAGLNDESNKERLTYAFEVTQQTPCTLTIRAMHTADWTDEKIRFELYTSNVSGSKEFTYENVDYYKGNTDETPVNKSSSYWTDGSASLTLNAGQYILAIRKNYQPIRLDYIIIQTDEEALCAGTFYTVTFDMQGHGSAITPQSVKENGLVKKPTDPTASGWVFGGWYKEAGCTNQWNFATDEVTAATTLYAKWQEGYKVAYYDGDTKLGTETVIAGETPQQYKKYQKKINHDFVGWYNESGLSSPADFNAAINENKNFYGKWTPGLVDNMIVTGNNTTSQGNGNQTMTAESVEDINGFFNHNVLQFTYSGMNASGDYRGINVNRDAGYNSSLSNGATGFGFYYKTAAGQTITFCFDYGDGGNQKKTELPSTNGFWKYAYVKGSAANGWNNENVIIYVNGSGGAAAGVWTPSSLNVSSATTAPNKGTFYIAEICATQKTTKPEESAATYTVTFDVNGHSSAPAAQQVADGGKVTQPANPQAMGWGFDGWYKEQACTHAWNFSTDVVTEDITLYAKWNVGWTFYCNSESNVGHKLIDNGDGTLTWTQHIDANITDYFHFSDGSGYCYAVTGDHIMDKDNCTDWIVYQNHDKYVGLRTTAAGDYVFTVTEVDDYATQLNVSVTYPASVGVNIDYQGHGGNNYTIYTNPNTPIANKDLPQTPSATNYTFGGWYETPECTGSSFDFSTAINANKTLYAKWTFQAPTYYYRGAKNGWGTTEMTPSDDHMYSYYECIYKDNHRFKISISTTTYDYGYTYNSPGFNGTNLKNMNSSSSTWDEQDGASIINSGSDNTPYYILVYYPNTRINNTSNPVICAAWSLPNNFDTDGGTKLYFDNSILNWTDGQQYFRIGRGNHSLAQQLTKVAGTANLYETTTPSYENYEAFTIANGAGWTGENNTIYQPSDKKPTSPYVITHLLEYQKYILDADLTFTPGAQTSTDGNDGHYYAVTKTPGLKTQNVSITTPTNGTITVTYTDIDNSSVNFTSGSKTVAQTCILTITATPEEGYELATNGLVVTGATLKNGQYVVNGTTTVSATFVPKTYTITLDKGAHGTSDGDATATYDSNTLSITHVGTPAGYTLTGYYTAATDGTKVINAEGTLETSVDGYTDADGNWVKDDNCTLYAQWTINQHTLTWITDGDALTGDYTHGTVDYGTTITAPNTPTKTGYTFAGWSSEVPATMPDNDVTLTATWTIINYTITYYNVEASEHTNPETYTITSADITLSAPTARTGYEFGGWYLDSNFGTKITTISTGSHENKDIYAKWTAKTYNLTLDANEGSANGRVTVTYDSHTTTDFSAPTRDNYIIEGFYAENTCTTKVMNADGTLCTSVENYTDASGNWVKDEACTLYTKWAEKPKVDALIVTGDANNVDNNDGGASFTYTHSDDAFFNHEVLKIEYSGMSGSWGNSIISIDNGYQPSSSTGATGFGLWYKTGEDVTSIAFCLDYNNKQDQKKTQLPGTNGAWKYVYVKSSHASGWNDSKITIWMNGQDKDAATGDWTPSTLPHSGETTNTNPSSGVLYISEIRATEITEKFINYTVNFTQPTEGQGTVTAQIKGGAAITTGTKVPEGTQVIFTWEKATGYEFDNFFDGTDTHTQNPCTLTVNSDLTVTTSIKVAVPKYDLTVSVNDNNMGTATGTDKYAEGDKVSLTATPNEHYRFVKWTVEGEAVSTDANYTYTMPNKATTIVANFEAIPQYTITVSSDDIDKGTVTGSGTYYEGDEVTITATPKAGYAFDKWNDNDTNASRKITVSESQTYTAYFKVDYCKPYLQIDCDDYDKSKVSDKIGNDSKATVSIIDDYIQFTEGEAVCYPIALPAGTYNIRTCYANATDVWFNRFTKGGHDSHVTYDGTTYGNNSQYKQLSDNNNNDFIEDSWNEVQVSGGTYIISLTSKKGSGSKFKWIRIYKTSGESFCPEMRTVTFPQPEHGTVTARIKNGATISSGDQVPENTVVVFTASDIAGNYKVVNWIDGESHELAGAVNSFKQTITSNISVTANIEEETKKYTVTATAGDHGTITSGENDYPAGATVTIVTAPDANYKVGSAMASNVDNFTIEGNNVSFTMPAAPVAVTVYFVFDEVHNMIATGTSANIDDNSLGGSGSITKSAVESSAFDHTVLQYYYNISSNDYCGYSLPTDAGYTVESKATGIAFWYMTSSDFIYMEIKADGQESAFGLENTNGTWKYIYVDNSYAATATSFQVWMNHDGKGSHSGKSMSSNTGTLYITEIQATNVISQEPIVPKVNLTVEVSPVGGGTVATDPEITTGLVKGSNVTLTASPQTGYRFVNWTVGGTAVSTEATYNRIVNATETITANFVRVYTLTITNDDHGTATVSPNQAQFAEGDKFTLTAQPTAGYAFDYYMDGDNKIETDPYEFTMSNSDRTISVHFKKSINYYDINTAVSGDGTVTIKVDGETHSGQQILEGTQVTLTATPNSESYAFTQWQDGNTDNPRTIIANETTAAITWTATFALRHTVTATFGKPGTKVTGQGEYATGAQVTLEAQWTLASKDFTYGFKEWTNLDGVYLSDEQKVSNPLTFTMPSANVSMKATFAPVECVDTFVIQCEDDQAYIPWNKQDEDLTEYPNSIPHDGECGPYHDYYKRYHGTGYYDYKKATSAEMYYPIELPASTYKFEVWSASNGNRNCWMNLYIESDDANSEVVYKDVYYKKTNYVTADNDCGEGGDFAISGTIDNVVLSSPKSVIIGLYCGSDYGAFDQIKITATDESEPFCHELSTETFTINSGETKEIPVCGVNNLIIYDGGQAKNDENVEVKTSVKHIRQVKQLDVWEDFALPFTATSIQVEDPDEHVMVDIFPAVRQYDDKSKSWNVKAGYFLLEELQHDDMATVIGTEFRQRWEKTQDQFPQESTPYIIEFTSSQSNGLFLNTFINYIRNGSTEVRGYDNATVDHGSWPTDGTKPTYHYVANNSVVPVYPNDAYVLNDDHTEFVLTDHPTILPFHCYIQASAETKANAPRLRLVGGGSTPTLIPVVEALNVDAEGVFKFIMDDKVYILRNGVLYNAVGQHVK